MYYYIHICTLVLEVWIKPVDTGIQKHRVLVQPYFASSSVSLAHPAPSAVSPILSPIFSQGKKCIIAKKTVGVGKKAAFTSCNLCYLSSKQSTFLLFPMDLKSNFAC